MNALERIEELINHVEDIHDCADTNDARAALEEIKSKCIRPHQHLSDSDAENRNYANVSKTCLYCGEPSK